MSDLHTTDRQALHIVYLSLSYVLHGVNERLVVATVLVVVVLVVVVGDCLVCRPCKCSVCHCTVCDCTAWMDSNCVFVREKK
jgi:hypothetical protein